MAEEQDSLIRARIIIEVLGKPKEHVEEAIKGYLNKIRQDDNVMVVKDNTSDSVEKEGFWLVFAEIEIVVKGLQKLIAFCFEYMPSSLEIIKPTSFTTTNNELAGFFNDLQARLHNVDMIVKQLKSENSFVKRNMRVLLQNTTTILLKAGSLSLEQMSMLTGVSKNELDTFLNSLIKENKIKKEGNSYKLVENVQSQK